MTECAEKTNHINGGDEQMLKLKSIIQGVAITMGVTPDEIKGRSRMARLVRARQSVMWIAHRQSRWSLGSIGQAIGGRDHTTVLHGVRAVAASIDADPAVIATLVEAEAVARDIESGKVRYQETTLPEPPRKVARGDTWFLATSVAKDPENPASEAVERRKSIVERLSRMKTHEHEIGSRLWCEIQNARFFLAVGYPYQPTLAANATERRGVAA